MSIHVFFAFIMTTWAIVEIVQLVAKESAKRRYINRAIAAQIAEQRNEIARQYRIAAE